MPIPDLPNFKELLETFTFDEPGNLNNYAHIQIVDKSYGTDLDQSGRYIQLEFPEIKLWYKPSAKLSFEALTKKIQAELESRNHPSVSSLAKIFLSIAVLHKRFQQKPIECLNKVLENITTAKLKRFYIYPPIRGRKSFVIQGFTIGSFAIGRLNPKKFKELCRKAGSDFYDKYAREYVIDRLSIEQKLISVNIFDFTNINKTLSFPIPLSGIKPNASSLFAIEMIEKLMRSYFHEISLYYQDKFWELLLEEQHLPVSYGAPYLDTESKKFLNGSNFITILLEVGGKENFGWVEPALLQPSVDFASADTRIPKAINSLKDNYNFTDFRDTEIHQTIKTYSLFVSKAKRHYSGENYDEAFLHYVIALDLLLGEKGASTKSVTDRTAVLTYRKFDRKFSEQQKEISNFYDIRSKYVHAGVNVRPESIMEVESVCEEVLHCLLRLQMQEENHSDGFINKWLKNLDFLIKAIEADKEQEKSAYIENGIWYDEAL